MPSFNNSELNRILQQHKHLKSSLKTYIGLDVDDIVCNRLAGDAMETLLSHCLNFCKISAGCCKFEKYMDNSMITCIDRIQSGQLWHGSLHATRNKDLLALYQMKLNILHQQASAQLLIGMELNLTNFAMMHESQRTSSDEVLTLREENARLVRLLAQRSAWVEYIQSRWLNVRGNLQMTLDALRHLNLISRFAWNQLSNIVNVSLEFQHSESMID